MIEELQPRAPGQAAPPAGQRWRRPVLVYGAWALALAAAAVLGWQALGWPGAAWVSPALAPGLALVCAWHLGWRAWLLIALVHGWAAGMAESPPEAPARLLLSALATAQALGGAWCLSRWAEWPSRLHTPTSLGRPLALGLASLLPAAALLSGLGMTEWVPRWAPPGGPDAAVDPARHLAWPLGLTPWGSRLWSDALGLALVLPLTLVWRQPEAWRDGRPRRATALVGACLLALALGLAAWPSIERAAHQTAMDTASAGQAPAAATGGAAAQPPARPSALTPVGVAVGSLGTVLVLLFYLLSSGRRLALLAMVDHKERELDQCLMLLEETVAGYREQSDRLALVLRSTPAGFLAFDQDERVVFANAALADMLACRAEDLLGLDRREVAFRIACMVQGDASPLSRMLMDEVPPSHSGVLRVVLAPDESVQRVLEVSRNRVEGAVVEQVYLVVDVTQAVRLERSKTQFIANAAHEIRTPLTSILGYSQLLAHRPQMPPETRQRFQQEVIDKAQELNALLRNMLDLADLESLGELHHAHQPLAISAWMDRLAQAIKLPAGANPPRWQAPDEALWVSGSAERLQLMMRHLLANAWAFSEPGREVVVAWRAQALADAHPGVLITVSDHGIGMTQEQIQRAFERFYRADESGARPGFGLGLCIAKEVASLHGGRIDLDSTPGQGTVVSVWLPRLATPLPSPAAATESGWPPEAVPS